MTHVDDLYEPGDDREPEPDERDKQPLDLEDLQKLYDLAAESGGLPAWGQIVYLRVPDLIAELREARQRIAGWEALPTREEWTVTGGPNFPAEPGEPTIAPGEQAVVEYARRHETAQLWRRMLSVHPWEPIADKAPF